MTQNPHNAVINLGHHGGTVTMWAPNMSTPLVKMLCHRGPIRAMAVDREGRYMATAGGDGTMKIFDIRTFRKLHSYYTPRPADAVSISARGLLAVGAGGAVQVWRGAFATKQRSPYMAHRLPGKNISSLAFCPFEDVLGLGHSAGVSSIAVPGAGEPNFDALEANPFEGKKQRREHLVHSLLDKIPANMITLDPDFVGTVDSSLKDTKSEARQEYADAHKVGALGKGDVAGKKKKKKGNRSQNKRWLRKRNNIIDTKVKKYRADKEAKEKEEQRKKEMKQRKLPDETRSALDRFL